MASDNEWVPLPQKKNGSNKKIRENQSKIIRQLKEMFGSTFESDIIVSVAQNCNWKLELSIDTLITLSSNVQTPMELSNTFIGEIQNSEHNSGPIEDFSNTFIQANSLQINEGNFLNMNQNELLQQQRELQKFENTRCTNRSTNFEISTNEFNQKVGIASLCGLKVQYRLKGTENSDDDADVVIEEESSDYRIETPEPERVNVCQFLSTPTQCSPRTTFPKEQSAQVNCINTPSSLHTSQSLPPVVLSTVSSRLEDDINKGFKILILMRGAPGSGKSYLARNIVSRTVKNNFERHIFSTDDYFMKTKRGVYLYNSARIQEAHTFNYNRVLSAMRQGTSPIIVDNTNTKAWEMQNYAVIAVEHGYIIETLEPDTPWFRNLHELDIRNTHNVPKVRIRAMLERYEPNITGDRLLKMFSLNYAPNNKPPQIRQVPHYFPQQSIDIINNIPMVSYQFTKSSDEKPDRLIDNEALNTIAKEYAKLEPSMDNNNSNIVKVFNESWTEGSSYKEDSFLLEMAQLGAIGSERKVTQSVNHFDSNDINKLVQENTKSEDILTISELTDVQVKNETQGTDNNESNNEIESKIIKVHSISNCWDFTLFLNGTQIHSKIEEPDNNELATASNQIIELPSLKCADEDTEVSCILASTFNKNLAIDISTEAAIINLSQLTLADVCLQPTPDILEEISTPSNKSRSNSDSSLERVSDVDISQFEMCNPEIIDDVTITSDKPIFEDLNVEKQSSSSLGLLFSFIKNSFIGNDKEKSFKQTEYENTNAPEVYGSCANELDKLLYENLPVTKSFLPITKGDKFLEINNDNQSHNDFSSLKNINTKNNLSVKSNLNDKRNELFESAEFPQKESVMNVVEELLEASSDVEKVDQFDFSERNTATKSKELEKNFSERMENLHIRAKSEEDENKVLKEPIHLAFSGKNIFPEKLQAQTNDNPKSSKGISDNSTNSGGVNKGGGGEAFDTTNINGSVNNVYLINWRESPFPLDLEPLSITTDPQEIETKPETCERETYTDPYDFNALYVGGTDEYKIIEATNRKINETSRLLSIDLEEPPMRKLMLHKGTMTHTTILFRGPVFDIDSNFINEDHSEDLIARFSHLPRACVIDVYENLCRRDYNWTLDYLINIQSDNVMIYEQPATAEKASTVTAITETIQQLSASVTPSEEMCESFRQSNQQQVHSRSKRERYRASGDLLALKQQLEGKFVMSEESYAPHTLRVKRWKRGEFDNPKPEIGSGDLMTFDEQPPALMVEPSKMLKSKKLSRLDHPAMEEEEQEQPTEDEDNLEDETVEEEMMELRLGYEFIRVLESQFGSANFQAPDGLFPVIQIRKSMAQELHALWIESVQQQLWVMQEQLDCLIAKDAEYARSVEVEEARAVPDSNVPNLKEIMDMEMALATYSNDRVKHKYLKKTYNDLASHVTQQTLHEMFPTYDPAMLYEIYEAHDRNFDETVKVIEENGASKSTITMADVLKKRKILIDELQKQSSYQTSRNNQLENLENHDVVSKGDYENYENLQTYEDAVEVAHYSRAEARRQLALRNENYQKAAEACRKKNPEVAAYYSDVAKLHIRNMEAANVMAATAFLAAQTHILEADDTLDLHFLRVPEAIQALDIFLEHQLNKLTKGSRKYIFIITGRGARSTNGQSKIKPVVERKLNSRNIRFSEANPGMLKALLRKK